MFDHSNTRWVNPTEKPVSLDICISAEAVEKAKERDKRRTIVVPPQGTVLNAAERASGLHHFHHDSGRLIYTILPSELDNAIHQKRDGVVIGGIAPQLRIYDEAEPIVAAALQPEKLALAEALKVEAERKAEAEEAERLRLVAQADVRKAEEASEADKARKEAEAVRRELEEARQLLAKAEADKARAQRDAEKAEARLAEATKPAAAPAAETSASTGAAGDTGTGGGKRGGKAS